MTSRFQGPVECAGDIQKGGYGVVGGSKHGQASSGHVERAFSI